MRVKIKLGNEELFNGDGFTFNLSHSTKYFGVRRLLVGGLPDVFAKATDIKQETLKPVKGKVTLSEIPVPNTISVGLNQVDVPLSLVYFNGGKDVTISEQLLDVLKGFWDEGKNNVGLEFSYTYYKPVKLEVYNGESLLVSVTGCIEDGYVAPDSSGIGNIEEGLRLVMLTDPVWH